MRTIALGLSIIVAMHLQACATKSTTTKILSMGQLKKGDAISEKILESKSLYDMGEIEAAIANLRTFLDSHPYSPSQDQAYELVIEWLLQIKKHDEAKRIASYFLANHQKSPSVEKIIELFNIANQPKETEQHKLLPTQKEIIEENHPEEKVDELLDLENATSSKTDARMYEESFEKLAHYVLYQAPVTLIEPVAKGSETRPSWGLANARMALYHFHLGQLSESYDYAKRATGQLPKPEQAMIAELQNDIEQIRQVDLKSLGVILPLSGPFAPFGKKILSAMSIALNLPLKQQTEPIVTLHKDGIRIVVADSQGDQKTAMAQVADLIKIHHVALIIGEITNEPSLLAAQICQQFGVPMLSLSRHPAMTSIGKFIFDFNSSPSQQIEKLVDYAITTKGHRRFAMLFGRHNYGMMMSTMFFDAVIKKGGTFSAIEAYDPHLTTFFEPVKKLLGKYYVNARPEYRACLEKAPAANKKGDCRTTLLPVVDFDALFIPEFNKLAFIVPALVQEDLLVTNNPKAVRAFTLATKIDNPKVVQLLGANSWNDKNTMDKIANQINGAYFVDSVSFDNNEDFKQFMSTYSAMNTSLPTALEVFAHDAALLAIKILQSSSTQNLIDRAEVRNLIANFNGRVGLLSKISFLPNGELDTEEFGFEILNGAQVVQTNES